MKQNKKEGGISDRIQEKKHNVMRMFRRRRKKIERKENVYHTHTMSVNRIPFSSTQLYFFLYLLLFFSSLDSHASSFESSSFCFVISFFRSPSLSVPFAVLVVVVSQPSLHSFHPLHPLSLFTFIAKEVTLGEEFTLPPDDFPSSYSLYFFLLLILWLNLFSSRVMEMEVQDPKTFTAEQGTHMYMHQSSLLFCALFSLLLSCDCISCVSLLYSVGLKRNDCCFMLRK